MKCGHQNSTCPTRMLLSLVKAKGSRRNSPCLEYTNLSSESKLPDLAAKDFISKSMTAAQVAISRVSTTSSAEARKNKTEIERPEPQTYLPNNTHVHPDRCKTCDHVHSRRPCFSASLEAHTTQATALPSQVTPWRKYASGGHAPSMRGLPMTDNGHEDQM